MQSVCKRVFAGHASFNIAPGFFCSKNIIALLKPYGFVMTPLRYVNAGKKQVPCLYAGAHYQHESFAVESYETLKGMAACQTGFFAVYLSVENECGITASLNATLSIDSAKLSELKLSPLIVREVSLS